ncbi:hypothetical protein LVJ94_35195 [Pendulispora rubella]|uniref:Uncharacterized protein n=1 Tax=Pendulispora rubella TaxID=2741070 RepID=A0ABZ2KTW7_9BACT
MKEARLSGVARNRSGVARNWRLEAVYEEPSNDLARAEYAHWADEHGYPHGEFIQLQLAAVKRPLTSKEAAREAALLAAHGRHWLGPLAPITTGVRFRRGFPADLVILAQDIDLKRIEGHPAFSTIESLEFEHVHGGRCRRTGSSQLGIAHPVFRALRVISGIYGGPLLEACAVHRQLERVAWFVPPEATGSMSAAPAPAVVARALRTLPALRHVRVGNDAITTSSAVDKEIARIVVGGHPRLARVSVVADRRARGWLRRLRTSPAAELELRADGCGTMNHPGMALSVRIAGHAIHPRARAAFTLPALEAEQYGVRAFVGALPWLRKEGVEVVAVAVPDPSRNGPILLQAVSHIGLSVPTVQITPESHHE